MHKKLIFRSLRLRLLITMFLIIMIPVGAIAFFASRTSVTEFQRYVADDDTTHDESVNQLMVGILKTYYAQNHNWDNIQPLLEQLGQVTSTHILLVSPEGRVIADSTKQMLGVDLSTRRISQQAYIVVQFTPVGAVVVVGSPWIKPGINENAATFIGSVNRYLLAIVLIAGAVMLVLTLWLSRRMSQPLEALTRAVRQMAMGDLSQRVVVQSQDEIGELALVVNQMADSLAHNEKLRRNMVSDIAHEFRTPLSCIIGYLEALQDGVAHPTPDILESLHEEASLLWRLVIDLQDLALADAGQLKMKRKPTSLPEIIEMAVSALQPQAREYGLAIYVDLPGHLPLIFADAERVGQILRNLLKNALLYTPESGKITIRARIGEEEVTVLVEDTGIGIDPEHLPYVFERFYRADQSRTHETGGAGLGLAIVKQLVEAHYGSIWAESAPGAGCTFAFTLPTAWATLAASG